MGWQTWDFTQLIAPAGCLGCQDAAESPVCSSCLSRLELLTEKGCRRCGNPAVHADAAQCVWCQRLDRLPTHFCSFYPYREIGRELFHMVKYSGYWRLLRPLLDRGTSHLFRSIPVEQYQCLAPVPESFTRKWRRHFNPAQLIAEALASLTGLPVLDLLALKTFHAHQVGLTYAERRKNVRGRFRLKKDSPPRAIILVDDVLTTGATLQEATALLKATGADKIAWFTLLRTL